MALSSLAHFDGEMQALKDGVILEIRFTNNCSFISSRTVGVDLHSLQRRVPKDYLRVRQTERKFFTIEHTLRWPQLK